MNLTYVASTRLPSEKAHSIQIMNMCSDLVGYGIKLRLIVPFRFQINPRLKGKKPNLFRFYQLDHSFPIITLPNLDLLILEQYGIRIGMLFHILQEISFAMVAWLFTLSTTDVIYTRSKPYAAIRSLLRQPVIFESHAQFNHSRLDTILARSTTVTCITKPIQKSWAQQSATTLYLPDGVSSAFFHPPSKKISKSSLGIKENATIISYIGSLSTLRQEKGVDLLLRALSQLLPQNPRLHCLIVGGPQHLVTKYQKLAKQLQISHHVTLTGEVNYSTIPAYQHLAHILVIPFPYTHHFAYNASPLKLFEYLAAGKPILATKLPSLQEILSSQNSYLVQPDSASSLARGLTTILSHPQTVKIKAARAKRLARQYTWHQRALSLIQHIHSLPAFKQTLQ